MRAINNIVLILFMLIGWSAFGQKPQSQGPKNRPSFEKLEEMRLSFVLNKLELNDAEKEKFEPLYEKYRKEYLTLAKGPREHGDKRPTEEDIQNMTDEEAKALVENDLARKRKMLDHKEKYFREFSKIISVKKVALLFQAEIDFQKKLFRGMKRRGDKRPKRNP